MPRPVLAPTRVICGHHPSLAGVRVRLTFYADGTLLIERTPVVSEGLSKKTGEPYRDEVTFAPLTCKVENHKRLIYHVETKPCEWAD